MLRGTSTAFAASVCAVIGIGVAIEATGGLPSQVTHLYYVPVVVSALLLPMRLALVVAFLAVAAVSPLPDVVHRALGRDLYYADPVPWNLSPDGWLVRPLAFVAVSLLAGRLAGEKAARVAAQETSEARGGELNLLARIDRLILGGASEREALQQIARLVAAATGARMAGIVVRDDERLQLQAFYGHVAEGEESESTVGTFRLGEGVAGWTLLHAKATTSRNVFQDPRYERMKEFARRYGYVSSAAAPILLDKEAIAALVVGYQEEREFTSDELATLQRVADQAAIAVANARQRESLQRLARDTAIALASAIENRDPYTGDHCARLAEYAGATAEALGLSGREVEVIRLGAIVHDVGKIVVPDDILKKPARLTPDEYAIVKQHCYTGGQICKRVAFLEPVYPIVYHHHERFDGRGYPDGLAGERIPLGARIVSVVDAYDAMTTDRPYRKAVGREQARALLLAGAGSQWDARVVETFLSLKWETSAEGSRRPVAA